MGTPNVAFASKHSAPLTPAEVQRLVPQQLIIDKSLITREQNNFYELHGSNLFRSIDPKGNEIPVSLKLDTNMWDCTYTLGKDCHIGYFPGEYPGEVIIANPKGGYTSAFGLTTQTSFKAFPNMPAFSITEKKDREDLEGSGYKGVDVDKDGLYDFIKMPDNKVIEDGRYTAFSKGKTYIYSDVDLDGEVDQLELRQLNDREVRERQARLDRDPAFKREAEINRNGTTYVVEKVNFGKDWSRSLLNINADQGLAHIIPTMHYRAPDDAPVDEFSTLVDLNQDGTPETRVYNELLSGKQSTATK